MKKIIFALLAIVVFTSISNGQITTLRWRDSSSVMVPVKPEPIKVAGVTVTGATSLGATTITNALTVTGGLVAGVDSFLTTSLVDTIQILGVTTTSIFTFANKTFDYSTAIDTVTYSYRLKTDTLIVTRVKTPISGGTVKSGGQYSYIRIKK
jgi:hypothetical protein